MYTYAYIFLYQFSQSNKCVDEFVALVFRHLRNFGPSGRIGAVTTYQLTKKLKKMLTKGNGPIKLLVYTFFKYFIDTTWHVRILMLTNSIEAALIASTFIFLQGASIDTDLAEQTT